MRLDPTPSLHSIVNGLNCPYSSPMLIALGFTTPILICKTSGETTRAGKDALTAAGYGTNLACLLRSAPISTRHELAKCKTLPCSDHESLFQNFRCILTGTRAQRAQYGWGFQAVDPPVAMLLESCPPGLAHFAPRNFPRPSCCLELAGARSYCWLPQCWYRL